MQHCKLLKTLVYQVGYHGLQCRRPCSRHEVVLCLYYDVGHNITNTNILMQVLQCRLQTELRWLGWIF